MMKRGVGFPIEIGLDRVQLLAEGMLLELLSLAGFRRTGNHFVRSQTSMPTYRRVETFVNRRTGSQLFVQKQRACSWLSPLKITAIPEDRTGFSRPALHRIFWAFKSPRLLTFEVAVDFAHGSGIDHRFVRRHALLGRGRIVSASSGDHLRFGSRRSDAFARAYDKPEVHAFRFEAQFQSGFLRQHGLRTLDDLCDLSTILVPSRIRFVSVNWKTLRKHLTRKNLPVDYILQQAWARRRSIHLVLGYLRREARIANVHRFLVDLPLTAQLSSALSTWALCWANGGNK